MARLLLRAESIASSKLEGLQVGSRRLLKAQLSTDLGVDASDVTATEILGNIDAMQWAVDSVAGSDTITVDLLRSIHQRLLTGTRLEGYGGVVRQNQNWIGGSDFNPCSADFVPPPPDVVDELLEDLCAFCNETSLPPVVQAALAHAQLETIHPFVDGNGRTGRALIHVILRRRGLTTRVLAPVSLVLATWSRSYVSGLMGTRSATAADCAESLAGWDDWISLFASAVNRSVADAELYQQLVAEVQAEWRQTLGKMRADSAANALISALPGAPLVTVQGAAALIGRSTQATNEAVTRLVLAGVLKQTTIGRRNRAFEATELINALNRLERQLASPDGDTRFSPPARLVPKRPEPPRGD
jgi:Fic family protein